MTNSASWHGQEQRHGRHRHHVTGAAWRPEVRPADTAPAWLVSEVLTQRPAWPVEELDIPAARVAWDGRPVQRTDPALPGIPEQRPGWPGERPARRTVSGVMVLDTVPVDGADHPLPEAPATGLRKFDLGNVPASVTPPRSWRRAAWFAVGTSAAVVLGLTIAAVELMGRPVPDSTLIDALPAYPTGRLILAEPPTEKAPTDSSRPPTPTTPSSRAVAPEAVPADVAPPPEEAREAVIVSDRQSADDTLGQDTMSTTPKTPTRRVVGPLPLTPTDPQAMGDRTEQYFALVTLDSAAAHAMTAGLGREGADDIAARYAGVRWVEVQDITIDRNHGTTTSTVKVIRQDGTESVERRQLSFTWGGDPKITSEMITK
ncbi:hypothetical protein [Actinophytocola sp.]|uniref:hypothetical protein n=1 Tax=Actinophytocola sp. TaxID=1872138 RepID=UPI002ED4213B